MNGGAGMVVPPTWGYLLCTSMGKQGGTPFGLPEWELACPIRASWHTRSTRFLRAFDTVQRIPLNTLHGLAIAKRVPAASSPVQSGP